LAASAILGEDGAIFAEARQTQGAKTLGQARIDQRRLGFRKIDSRVVVQHLRDAAEVLLVEEELALDELSGLFAVARL
jgi:hypothetical protein